MRYRFGLLAILLISPAGCGPAVSKEDLGTVVFELPKVPGADTPYQMPQPESPPEHGKDHVPQHLP